MTGGRSRLEALLRALRAAADHDLDDTSRDPVRRARKLLAVVGTVAFSTLLLEVLLTRMYPFFLGDVSSFVAIPVAMFGLSLGALALHVDRRVASPSAIPVLMPALLVLTLGSYFGLFFLFDHVFNLTHHQLQSPPRDALKTACLSLVFVPPFAVAGIVLSIAFRAGASSVGRLYASDLAGSALACVAAPVLLHFTDLPVVICLQLGVLLLGNLALFSRIRWWVAGLGGGALAVLTLLAADQRVFVEHPDPEILGVRYSKGHTVTEHGHRWNDVSRVSLVSWEKPGAETTWRVLHDDGVSNVVVAPWDPARIGPPPKGDEVHALPFLLDTPPERALVIFAGAGRDMIQLLEQARGHLDVTGVEINGLVPVLATRNGDPFDLQAFYDLPNAELVIDEGRAFLNRDPTTYDLVFAGSNGAQTAVRTGHVRKFLDTAEATEAYLDHLRPGGLLVFYVQPFTHKLEILKRLFEDRSLPPLSASAIALGSRSQPRPDSVDSLLVKPGGFSAGEVERIVAAAKAQDLFVHYAPGVAGVGRALFTSPPDRARRVPTDDRPYERPLLLAGFTPFPALKKFDSLAYSLDWIKIFTTLLFLGLCAATIAAFQLRRRGPRRMPLPLGAYFLGSGVCYMFAEIGLMSKLELFMGMPLYSTAVVLASFLLANAAGSAWVGRRADLGRPVRIEVPAVAAAVLVPATLLAIDAGLVHLLWMPVALKAPLAVAVVAPLAVVLGMFYPLGVGLVTDRGLDELVPMTFGLATLSSVVGSTFALVAMINVGFREIVWWADAGYVALALVALGVRFLGRAGASGRA